MTEQNMETYQWLVEYEAMLERELAAVLDEQAALKGKLALDNVVLMEEYRES